MSDLPPLSVDPSEIIAQREKGWADFHPETYCHLCGQRNVWAWSVASHLWNEVMEPHEIVCPQCFTEAYKVKHADEGVWWTFMLRDGESEREALRRRVAALEEALLWSQTGDHRHLTDESNAVLCEVLERGQ